MSKTKVIIWGFPLDTHTHSYTHSALYNAFKHLGHDAYWFHHQNYPDPAIFDYSNSLFITEGFADIDIPILSSSTYFVHNAINPGKYLEKDARLVDIRFNVSEINDYNYNMVVDKKELTEIDPVSFYNPKADDSVLGDRYKKGLSGYEALHTIWATNLLPHEINLEDRFIQRENKFYFIGTIGGSPALEMQKVAQTLHELGIPFVHRDPWSNPCTFEENKSYMQKSIISLDVRGSDAYHTNSDGNLELHGKPVTGGNHKKIGFIPCRIIKQMSFGRLPGTNSSAVKDLFGDYVIYNDDESKLPIDCLNFEKNPNHDLIYECMRNVQQNHTFINRANAILKVFNKEV
tara:strand:- start:632 stop:1669 length:1038 start_codon:yes stop_codon:yes gene_type:complete